MPGIYSLHSLFYPLYWISYDQMTSNMTSQAATMTLNGVPNEIVNNLNPISLVIFVRLFHSNQRSQLTSSNLFLSRSPYVRLQFELLRGDWLIMIYLSSRADYLSGTPKVQDQLFTHQTYHRVSLHARCQASSYRPLAEHYDTDQLDLQ